MGEWGEGNGVWEGEGHWGGGRKFIAGLDQSQITGELSVQISRSFFYKSAQRSSHTGRPATSLAGWIR